MTQKGKIILLDKREIIQSLKTANLKGRYETKPLWEKSRSVERTEKNNRLLGGNRIV